ncbi:helix-turn-helix transcriptional regulator [Roseobacter sinensis]|uniref:YafY family transcriptional regulator n=1 Tax=Roseobacter sinensis TaxID=2931391 RepID=A0ABT3BCH2_9RHOB|nr:YafY family protein [Roseobacter sp. WL0113]MCV3271282.1 YafY family transcriptional regulator [Roseobacter sp. WL0113]
MRRGDRLFEIIEILRRAKNPMSGQSIGDELGVTKRTVYRDVAALMAQGVPIQGEAGVGYVLEAGFHMPPLMLTSDEIEAAILGAQWVRTRGEPDLALAAEKLLTKIETVTPARFETSFVEPVVSVAPVAQPAEALDASEIRRAIRRRVKIALTYRDSRSASTKRVIWPILLGYRDEGRIVAAWCELRHGFRYFRTERIVAGEILEEKIPRRMDLLRTEWQAAMEDERLRYGRAGRTE